MPYEERKGTGGERMTEPKILLCGDCAVTVEFGNAINEEINSRIRDYIEILRKEKIQGVTDILPTFRSVLINYDPRFITYDQLKTRLEQLFTQKQSTTKQNKRIVEIPVCYGGEYGPDLAYVASHAGLTEEEVIRIHSSKEYLIYMLGFLPGFSYLGGLDERLFTPRLTKPRVKIKAGSVGIGGEQTGIYPLDSPGGWQLIGSTPIQVYDSERDPAILYEAGDYIRFVPIDEQEYKRIKELCEQQQYAYHITGGK